MNSSPLESSLPLNDGLIRFIESMGIYYEGYGIPRIGGRMMGLFLITTQAISAEQIAELLDTSLSSVSTNVRALIANGWVEKVSFPGDRTTYFRFSPSAWENVMERRRQGILPLKALAEQARSALPPDAPAQAQLSGMVEWATVLISHYEGLITAWRTRRIEDPTEE